MSEKINLDEIYDKNEQENEEKQTAVKNRCESTLADLLEIAVYEEILNKQI